MRVNTFLLFQAKQVTNGANIHRAVPAIRGYQMAIECATDPRCKFRKHARHQVAIAE